MGDRKELNKYIPPDFDPRQLSRVRVKKQAKELIRFMLPCGVQCSTCGEFMGAGKKFNAKKESGGMYLKIRIYRFYWKCNVCSTECVMSTDPKNSDYKLERGGTRIFDIHRAKADERDAEETANKELADTSDAMTAMEAKAEASRREMDSLAALETLQAQGERNRNVGPDQILQQMRDQSAEIQPDVSKALQEQEEQDAAAAQEAFASHKIRRIPDPSVTQQQTSFTFRGGSSCSSSSSSISSSSSSASSSSVGRTAMSGGIKRVRDPAPSSKSNSSSVPVLLKRRKKNASPAKVVAPPSSAAPTSLIPTYASSSDDDSD